MALPNGVLVHGPTAWGCAVRPTRARSRSLGPQAPAASSVEQPFLRGPLRLAESFALIPEVRRKLPEARLAVRAPGRAGRDAREPAAVQVVRRSDRLGDAARELLSGALSLAPAVLALRGGELAAYHGAEHISIGTYEHGEQRAKEHERCGSHLIGPLLAASAPGNVLAARRRRSFAGRRASRAPSARSARPSRSSPG